MGNNTVGAVCAQYLACIAQPWGWLLGLAVARLALALPTRAHMRMIEDASRQFYGSGGGGGIMAATAIAGWAGHD